ncbi:hypothetical protein [Streptomyces triticirhizae]|uniref:Uncharacterized protein n=1 Tax=Streptomyces triticirhizae TaxID=2483353 RepID=A0A3M2KY77_9ACTN|nr:hypothetical protein [Streptomyces triticirhizae]RMI29213.1 hypothetical protein EBN88_27685 [Streptomyces triticirhizae]
MNSEELIELLTRHQDHVREHLTPDERRELRDALAALERAGNEERARRLAVLRIRRVLLDLPLDSPVRRAVSDGVRLLPGGVDEVAAGRVAELRALVAAWDAPPALGRDPAGDGDGVTTEDILRAARRRLLAAPSRPADQVAPGAAEGLIRLPDPERGARCPEFQFGPDGGPRAVVRRVNALLLADEDPWGAADWWLGGNVWLEGTPAELVGEIPDFLLVEAARALVEGD